MKNIASILVLLGSLNFSLMAQQRSQHSNVMWAKQSQVLDSTEGILIYNRMMGVIKADFETIKKNGYEVKGWNEEYYDSGQLLHVSYYRDSKLVLFKNFFENGQCQHNVTYTDSLNCAIDVYFDNGSLKNQIAFYSGVPKKLTDFFPNGLPKNNIEYDTELQRVFIKRNWYVNAEVQSELAMTDQEGREYSLKLFYPNGQIKQEGQLHYREKDRSYYKIGTWTSFESSGKKKHSEKFDFNLDAN